MNRRLLVVAATLGILALAAAYLLVQPSPFTVGIQPLSINHPMMYAIDGGFFSKQRLRPKVQLFGSANDALDAVLGGSVFIDATIPIQNIAAIQQQQPGALGIAAVLLSDNEHPLDYLVAPSSSPIKSALDLSGKTIVVFPGSYSETVTRLAFAKLGVTNINFIKRSPSDMPQALQTGQADAGVLYDPIATEATVQGWGRIIERAFWENHLLPVMVVGGYAYNMADAKKHPERARQALAALDAAITDAQRNPREAKMAMKRYVHAADATIALLPSARIELADQIDPRLIDLTLDLYANSGIIPKRIDLRPLLRHP